MGKAQNIAATPYQAYGSAPVAPKDIGAAPDPKDPKYIGGFDPLTGTMTSAGSANYKEDKAAYDAKKALYDEQAASYDAARGEWDALTPEQQAQQGQRVAGLTDDSLLAAHAVRTMRGATDETMGLGNQYIRQAGAANTNEAIGDYLARAQNGGLGEFDQAKALYGGSAGADTAARFSPYAGQATDFTYQAGQQANPLIQASTNPTGLAAASPFLAQAGQPASAGIGGYMSPYTTGVVNAIADQSARNLQEKLMPALSDDFIRAGQYGSTRQQELAQNLIRDVNQDTLNQQRVALESGFGQAAQLAQQDAARQAQLAGTAGGLGSEQQRALLGAGQSLGNLGLGQANQLTGIGTTAAGTAATDAARQIQAAQGISNIGQANQQQSLGLANIASQNQLADAMRKLQAGTSLGNLSQQWSDVALQQANAQNVMGQQQQVNQQTSLDTAYQDFLNQRNQPQQQVDFLSSVVRGLPVNTSSYQSATGPGTAAQMQPSAVGQIAGAGLGLAGLSKLFSKGGAVRAQRSSARRAVPSGIGSFARAA